ncbi:MAG TPA: NAD(P)-dependent oxidoreductase [Gaiellaceae bacterium]|nr:NAD(P)-dependent oxidoreductase [Gaiellaceae bacterium]
MPPRVRLAVSLVPSVEEELRLLFDVSPELPGADGAVTMPSDQVDAAFFERAGPQLRIVAQHAVGLDNVDLAEAERRGIVVSNTPGVLTDANAELALALMLALLRRVAEGDRLIRRGESWMWQPNFMLGTGLRGKTLGVVGMGRIGSAVARLAEAHGMTVKSLRGLDGVEEVDVLTLHCPLTPETRHLVDAAALERMKPTAVLVNAARGPVVDEAALAAALRRGVIAGAALDVFEREPEVEAALLELENVVLCPHLGSATVEAREAMGRICLEALKRELPL